MCIDHYVTWRVSHFNRWYDVCWCVNVIFFTPLSPLSLSASFQSFREHFRFIELIRYSMNKIWYSQIPIHYTICECEWYHTPNDNTTRQRCWVSSLYQVHSLHAIVYMYARVCACVFVFAHVVVCCAQHFACCCCCWGSQALHIDYHITLLRHNLPAFRAGFLYKCEKSIDSVTSCFDWFKRFNSEPCITVDHSITGWCPYLRRCFWFLFVSCSRALLSHFKTIYNLPVAKLSGSEERKKSRSFPVWFVLFA